MQITAFDLAHRFVGMKEVSGSLNNPAILAMLRLDNEWPTDDAVPWCSAFTNYVAWLLNLPRSKSLLARSWLVVGRAIELADARAGFDVVILRRSNNPLAGHVAFYGGVDRDPLTRNITQVHLLGGNQGDSVSLEPFEASRVVGVRRLLEES
jgi:uncharacterized protein (TIGR02594 family)